MNRGRRQLTNLGRLGSGLALLGCVFAMLAGTAQASESESCAPVRDREGNSTIAVHNLVTQGHLEEAGSGLEVTPDPDTQFPVAGAQFQLSEVVTSPKLDVLSNEGIAIIEALIDQMGTSPRRESLLDAAVVTGLNKVEALTTDSAGTAVFTGLQWGLYYVEETKTPAGFSTTAPFLVVLPATHPQDSCQWIYDLHVYPKDRYAPLMTVADQDSVTGEDGVTWTVYTSLPAEDLVTYRIEDLLDSHLIFDGDMQVSLTSAAGEKSAAVQTFAPGTDYTVSRYDDVDEAGLPTERLVVNFLPGGLDKLNAADNQSLRPTFNYSTTITGIGHIANRAHVYENNIERAGLETPIAETNEVVTRWADLKLRKVDAEDGGETLAGAKFDLYAAHTDDFKTARSTGKHGITGADGMLELGPVRYSDFSGSGDVTGDHDNYWYFWLVETEAPEGYRKLSEPVAIEIRKDLTDDYDSASLTIRNVKENQAGGFVPGGSLAVTGATVAVVAMLAIMAVLVGGAVKRKGDKQTHA